MGTRPHILAERKEALAELKAKIVAAPSLVRARNDKLVRPDHHRQRLDCARASWSTGGQLSRQANHAHSPEQIPRSGQALLVFCEQVGSRKACSPSRLESALTAKG